MREDRVLLMMVHMDGILLADNGKGCDALCRNYDVTQGRGRRVHGAIEDIEQGKKKAGINDPRLEVSSPFEGVTRLRGESHSRRHGGKRGRNLAAVAHSNASPSRRKGSNEVERANLRWGRV